MFNKTFTGVDKVIFGLGNPGEEYNLTRHNFGKQVIEKLAQEKKLKFKKYKKFYAVQTNYQNKNILLLKSLTYMNLSGEALQQFPISNFQFPINEKLLVIVDDVNLPFGKIRFRKSGSAGGHNGLKSIIHNMGNDNFARLRLGIAPINNYELRIMNDELKSKIKEQDKLPLEKFVLEKFTTVEQKMLPQIINVVIDGLKIYLEDEEKGVTFWNNFKISSA